nr:DUF58 domain-containing protein [Kineosporia babensis]
MGPGSETEELTRYQPGDDIRRIDWNATARSVEPQVWRTRAEHALDTWLLLDRTASMSFGTAQAEKSELATQLAAAVGLIADQPGNRMGILAFSSQGPVWTRPTAARVAARRLMRSITQPEATERRGAPPAHLGEMIDALGRRANRPGVCVVVSDLLAPDGRFSRPFEWEKPLRRLASRHEVLILEVLDPRELELPDVGHVVLQDPETGRRRDVFTGDRALRERYAQAAAAHRAAVADAVRYSGAGHLQLRTDRDWLADLLHAVRHRRLNRRRVRR